MRTAADAVNRMCPQCQFYGCYSEKYYLMA